MKYLIRALRLPLTLIPAGACMPILVGPLRGARWVVGAGNHVAWMGVYELRKQIAFRKSIRAGATVYDIGAHAGFYTLLASRLVGPRGRVIAFEPARKNIDNLRRHLALNHTTNVQVIEAAVAERTGQAGFAQGTSTDVDSSYLGRLVPGGENQVQTVSLDDLVQSRRIPPPDYIKMDIEGGEVLALEGARRVLEQFGPMIFLATHGPEAHRVCLGFLASLDYAVVPLLASRSVAETDELVARPRAGPAAQTGESAPGEESRGLASNC